jgi:hypothetical protein
VADGVNPGDSLGYVERLADECDVFTRYLIGEAAPADVRIAYQRGHGAAALTDAAHPSPRDRATMAVATRGPGWARAADSFAAVAGRGGLLRRKLVLLVAILESRGDSSRQIDAAVSQSLALWVLRVGVAAIGSVLRGAGAGLVILVLTIMFTLTAPASSGAGRS